MSDKVSVVVPVHNAEKYIGKTVESVLNQTYSDLELILVENGSTDNTPQILEGFTDERIKVISLSDISNAAQARNAGVEAASGRYIAYVDADDLWMADKLEKQLKFMKEQNAEFCFTGYEFGDEEARPTGVIVKVPMKLSYEKALRNTTIFTSTVCFDMSVLTKEDIMMPCIKSEDTALWWKLLRNGRTAFGLDENLVIYRRPSKSLSSNKFEAIKRIWNLYRNWEKLGVIKSSVCFAGWAFRAVKRRV